MPLLFPFSLFLLVLGLLVPVRFNLFIYEFDSFAGPILQVQGIVPMATEILKILYLRHSMLCSNNMRLSTNPHKLLLWQWLKEASLSFNFSFFWIGLF